MKPSSLCHFQVTSRQMQLVRYSQTPLFVTTKPDKFWGAISLAPVGLTSGELCKVWGGTQDRYIRNRRERRITRQHQQTKRNHGWNHA